MTMTASRHAEIEAAPAEACDLAALALETKRRGYMAFAVLLTGSERAGLPYVACFLTKQGRAIENTFSEYATPDAALSALLSQSRKR